MKTDLKKQLPQKRRYSDGEFNTIKQYFADNEPLLIAIRKHFLEMAPSASEQDMLDKTFKNKDAVKVVSKTFLPTLDGDAPFGQMVDLWMTIKIDDKNPEEAYPHLVARETLIKYVSAKLRALDKPEEDNNNGTSMLKLSFDRELSAEENYSNLLARNVIISHVEQQIFQLFTLAGRKEESVEETLERIQRDSSK